MTINTTGEIVTLKDDLWFKRQKQAGICVATILKDCGKLIENQQPNLSLKDLEQLAVDHMKNMECSATFLGYKGFPSAICASVNKQLVHGIVTDYILQDGDIVTIDLGATYEGAIADAAYTFIYGTSPSPLVSEMIGLCKNALYAGIEAVKVGNKIGAIGCAINNYVKNSSFGLVTKYGGHGINYNVPHASPFIPNRANKTDGVRIQPGLTIAIEPMLTLDKDVSTTVLSDGWTVVGKSLNCHFEHSIFVTEDKVHVITSLD